MGRVLALDVGSRRTGVAVSDQLRITARPLAVLEGSDLTAIVAAVRKLIAQTAADVLVVGLPLLPSGDRGEQAHIVEDFVALLEAEPTIPVHLWDESYSTVEVYERRRARGLRPSEAAHADAEAAAIILESWLASAVAGGRQPTEPATEPATEPVTEPATEPATEPVTEPATEPVGR